MYCPKCGLQQPNETMRFCSRCGFQLGATSQLLTNNGMLPMNPQNYVALPPKQKPKGLKQGLMLILLSVVLLPVIIALIALSDSPAPLLISATIFLAGLARIIYSYAFKDEVVATPGAFVQPSVHPQWQQLPNPQNHAVTDFHQGNFSTGEMTPPTGELVSPTSVTEGTTALFDKKS
jgi:hypothetical protein